MTVKYWLQENENSGCRALLRDDKMDDLSRMFRVYHKIPQGLEPIVDNIQKSEDATTSHATNTNGEKEETLIRKLINLHDKYMVYVTKCFQNHTLFHKVLKEAFETFCNKSVVRSTSSELLATFCGDTLKKGGPEKLSDEAIEHTLESVVKLLTYNKTQQQQPNVMPPKSFMTRLILIMVWRKLILNPKSYSSLLGISWYLISFRGFSLWECLRCLLLGFSSGSNKTEELDATRQHQTKDVCNSSVWF